MCSSDLELVQVELDGLLAEWAEAVVLPDFGREQLLATLVVFRILYFLIPFGISIWIMGTRELWLSLLQPWLERRRLGEACTAKARPARWRRGCAATPTG